MSKSEKKVRPVIGNEVLRAITHLPPGVNSPHSRYGPTMGGGSNPAKQECSQTTTPSIAGIIRQPSIINQSTFATGKQHAAIAPPGLIHEQVRKFPRSYNVAQQGRVRIFRDRPRHRTLAWLPSGVIRQTHIFCRATITSDATPPTYTPLPKLQRLHRP
ncbi:uncharacterized protein CLUP02_17770 [Colletotrichum lupini]|uniref:Uncharacterized protein n=1 Tax=Colletotrichum lupini TaxID=145971 RepID=A0A9Q8SF68_9PEZI|nr:uncharacterized protein CLUP02_17770 [Colletotrichum lupini]UQC76257.1 hypothetical protein CLUP02_17770 [Colletotrichum lupini]